MMVYAYVHGITEFRENELNIQKVFSSVFVWNTVIQGMIDYDNLSLLNFYD